MRQLEHEEQVILINWAICSYGLYPELKLLFAVPNGGKRGWGTAKKLKSEGTRRGIPDLILPVPRFNNYVEGQVCWYHGLFIEMKKKEKGQVSIDQKWWHEQLRELGYRVEVCYGADEAKEVLKDYLLQSNS